MVFSITVLILRSSIFSNVRPFCRLNRYILSTWLSFVHQSEIRKRFYDIVSGESLFQSGIKLTLKKEDRTENLKFVVRKKTFHR